jgi:hypothetical protein
LRERGGVRLRALKISATTHSVHGVDEAARPSSHDDVVIGQFILCRRGELKAHQDRESLEVAPAVRIDLDRGVLVAVRTLDVQEGAHRVGGGAGEILREDVGDVDQVAAQVRSSRIEPEDVVAPFEDVRRC